MHKFSEDFVFGAATAAYQAEGGIDEGNRGENYWDNYLKESGSYDPSAASDFYHQYENDLRLSQQFGINGIGSPLLGRGFSQQDRGKSILAVCCFIIKCSMLA